MRRMRGALLACTSLGLVCLGLLVSSGVAAEPLAPRVLVVFDTSGSMGVDVATGNPTGGDNSVEHPGDGNLSRLFAAKEAVAALVQTQSEVEFALLRYPQREGAGINPDGGPVLNTYSDLDERPLNYIGVCEGQLRAEAPGDASSLLVPFGAENQRALVSWLDSHEAWPGDPELRADGPTPIAESLRLAHTYLQEVVAADPGRRCRRYVVLLLTDGSESCVPVDEREATLTAQVEALLHLEQPDVEVSAPVHVVAFGVNERALETLSVITRAAGTGVTLNGDPDPFMGIPHQANDPASLQIAFARVLREAMPTEVCNGVDDDCDGLVDEGVLNACGQCGVAPIEVCNGEDDDCDGLIDEGVLNSCGRCGETPVEVCNGLDDDCNGAIDDNVSNACGGCADVEVEVCNGIDDDCDGLVDNQPGTALPLWIQCSRDVGECRMGRSACHDGVYSGCDGRMEKAELCDGLDNDCDGQIDEEVRPCGAALELGEVGACHLGTRACVLGACDTEPCDGEGYLLECVGDLGPSEEVCDGRDNNCDGQIDEGVTNACGQCGPSAPELCNGVDDNCDGRADENPQCPPGHLCFDMACVQPCSSAGECPDGMTCVQAWPGEGYCHPNPCANVQCGVGQRCEPSLSACVDPCDGVDCPGQGCDLGACVPATCRHVGCAEGARCFGDVCVADLCAGVECGADAFCRDGACVPACRGEICVVGERCVDGVCSVDPCGGRCLPTERCDAADGLCVADLCVGVACPVGQACEGGECRSDAVCVGVPCPPGTRCVDGGCTDQTPSDPPDPAPWPDGGLRIDAGVLTDVGVPDAAGDAGPEVDAMPSVPGGGEDGCAAMGVSSAPVSGVLVLFFMMVLGSARRRLALVALALVAGCGEAPNVGGPAALGDGGPLVPDAFIPNICTPIAEVCNGVDDDCDGLVDGNDPDLRSALFDDPENCGMCGRRCAAEAAESMCQAGQCVIVRCDPGRYDRDGNPANGCEIGCVVVGDGLERCNGVDDDCDGEVDEGFALDIDVVNCGGCGEECPDPPGGGAACVAGACTLGACLEGRVDLDGVAENGCEYACRVSGGESCNGRDDDCDGLVDEPVDLVVPEDTCGAAGVCQPACELDGHCGEGESCEGQVCVLEAGGPEGDCEQDADCWAVHPGYACVAVGRWSAVDGPVPRRCQPRRHAPMCDGDEGWRCARAPAWQFGDETGRCDGLDNDCDGRIDEDHALTLFMADGVSPAMCHAGEGVCRRAGEMGCAPDGRGVVCGATAGEGTGADDNCDGLDDDCDGLIDEAFVDATVLVDGVEVFAFEASRPGATSVAVGRDLSAEPGVTLYVEARACSRVGVLPWTEVTWDEAQAACEAAGARLCTADEWLGACGDGVYPYGDSYDQAACNTAERRGEDAVDTTGAMRSCARDGIYDLSGNVKEWIAEGAPGAGDLRQVRGGSYQSALPGALTCDLDSDLKDPALRHPAVGFRCCR